MPPYSCLFRSEVEDYLKEMTPPQQEAEVSLPPSPDSRTDTQSESTHLAEEGREAQLRKKRKLDTEHALLLLQQQKEILATEIANIKEKHRLEMKHLKEKHALELQHLRLLM